MALGLVLGLSTPVSAGAASVSVVVAVSSPITVTVGHYVAYPVHVQNTGPSTLNTVSVSGTTPTGFTYVGAKPSHCNQSVPYCALGQMTSGPAVRTVTFYFLVGGEVPRTAAFQATVSTAEGSTDNSDGTANNQDTWPSNIITTEVVALTDNYVSGHGIVDLNDVSDPQLTTGLAVSELNPHGTSVEVRRNAEVTIEDRPPGALGACPTGYPTCFGWGSVLDVGTDDGGVAEEFPEGIVVTMRWDSSQLPSGMTPKKLRVLHILDDGSLEIVNPACVTDATSGLVTNMPCFLAPPQKVQDRDIEAVMLWAHNGIGRGW
jgi:uncharacterized repeat protein (TIGR01451 family)